jgi:multidrug efflux pump subunit AcrB
VRFRPIALTAAAVIVGGLVMVLDPIFQGLAVALMTGVFVSTVLTLVGILPGHAAGGIFFTATSMIGMIALAGIIVRNSILLVDFINLEVAQGVDLEQATINAAATRAKPIVLTGVAAMLGALFILDDPIFNGLAVALLFGIAVSTLLTLVVIPVLFYAATYRRAARGAAAHEAVAHAV